MFLAKQCSDVETAINEISKHIKENYNDLFLNVILTNKSNNQTSRKFKSSATDPFLSESLEKNIKELDQIQGVLKFSQNYKKLAWFSFMEGLDGKHHHRQNTNSDLSHDFVDTENFEYNGEDDYDYKTDPDYYYDVNDPLCRRPKYFGNSKHVAVSKINSKEGITLLLNQNKNPKIGEYIIFAFKSEVYNNTKEYINEVFSRFDNKNKFYSNPPLFPAMFIKRTRNV